MREGALSEAQEKHLEETYSELRKLGITYFSYGLIFQENILISCFSNKEWEKHYREKEYNKTDPLLLGVIHSNFPLIVWDALSPVGEERKVMMERNEMCCLKSGMTLGVMGTKCKEIMAFGSPASPKEFYSLFGEENLINKIHNIITNFYRPTQISKATRRLSH